jgi:hypothetical protein
MDPYASPPFLGPLHAVLQIDWKQFATLGSGLTSYSVSLPALPLQARLAGLSFGERFVPFADATPTTWTASVSLGGVPLLTSGVGVSNPPASPLPVGQLPAPFDFGQPIGNQSLQLSVSVVGSSLPATVTTQPLTPAVISGLSGKTLDLTTDDRSVIHVPFTPPPTTPAQVLADILALTNVDPVASLDAGNHLVLKNVPPGVGSTLTIVGGTALAALGLSPGTTLGTVSTPATVTGTQDLTTLAYAQLQGKGFTFTSSDRPGSFNVVFGTGGSAPTQASDVLTAIAAATNTDPSVILNAKTNQLVFTSGNVGATAFVKIGGTAASVLGLTTGYVYGTNGGALPATVTGTVDLSTLTYGASGTLNGQVLNLATDDRGPFPPITFTSAVTPYQAVVTAIEAVTNADPAASLSAGKLIVLTSASGVTIIDGTALAALGLSAGAQGTTLTGTKDLTVVSTLAALNGLSFTFKTGDRSPTTVTFGTLNTATDVVTTITAATNTDPAVSLDGNKHLVLQSNSVGSTASLSISGNAALTLGLVPPSTPPATVVTTYGTAAPALGAATAGRIDVHLFYFVDRR